jgi:hypothetical protein
MCDCAFHITTSSQVRRVRGRGEQIDAHNHRLFIPSLPKGLLLENPTIRQPNPRGSVSSYRREKVACYWVYPSLSYPFHPHAKQMHPSTHPPVTQSPELYIYPTPDTHHTLFYKNQTKPRSRHPFPTHEHSIPLPLPLPLNQVKAVGFPFPAPS